MDDRVRQFIDINVTGRVFMTCTGEGVRDAVQIRQYEKRVRDLLRSKVKDNTGLVEVEQYMEQELQRLAQEIRSQQESRLPAGVKPAATSVKKTDSSIEADRLTGLLQTDCVNLKLLTTRRAAYWQQKLSATSVSQIQLALVRELRQALHQQVKKFMRKYPHSNLWSTVRQREELHMKIINADSVEAVLQLADKIHSRIQQHADGKSGLLQRWFSGG